jgi:hypothetical protein
VIFYVPFTQICVALISPRFVQHFGWLFILSGRFGLFCRAVQFVSSARSSRQIRSQDRIHSSGPPFIRFVTVLPAAGATASVAIWCTAVPAKVQRFVLFYVLQPVASQSHPAYPWCYAAPHFLLVSSVISWSYLTLIYVEPYCRCFLSLVVLDNEPLMLAA